MFLDIENRDYARVAAKDDSGMSLTYGDLAYYADEISKVLPYRTLVFLMAENSLGSLIGYTSFLNNGVVPLILSNKIEVILYNSLFQTYSPEYIWAPKNKVSEYGDDIRYEACGYALIKTKNNTPKMHNDLAMLLPTSGSTGSPKLVRHSYRNIEANAENVVNLFQINKEERALASLPMHYTMGLSVISSHLKAGATILLCDKSLMDEGFWHMLEDEHATSMTGVPYSYELLRKLRFFQVDLPCLKTISQGGGKLTSDLWLQMAQYALDKGKRFIATYGQSECTARMAYLPAELAMKKICSIGIAEPGGKLSLLNEKGEETTDGPDEGELIYRGDNVTMGYAVCLDDLQKGDENHGVMHTGDLAKRDEDGCYFITGRMKRFLKIFGLRIGLDEVENLIRSQFSSDCYCSGTDNILSVKVTNADIVSEIPSFIEGKTHLFHQNIEVMVVDHILRNEAGKVINQ